MSITKTFYTLCFALLASSASAQDTGLQKTYAPKNTVFLELGGIGFKYSLNYQRNFTICKHFDVATGISVNPYLIRHDDIAYNKNTPMGELTLQGIYKFGKNELALGGAFGYYTYYTEYCVNNEFVKKMTAAPVVFTCLGYSYTWGKHIYTGAYFWLHIASNKYTEIVPWGGLRVGYRFGK